MRLTFVIASLAGGGAERVAAYMANHWAERGRTIHIVTICHGIRPPAYPLDPRVTHLDLNFYRRSPWLSPEDYPASLITEFIAACSEDEQAILRSEFHLIAALQRSILCTEPEVVISFMDVNNIRTLAATHKLGLPVIVSEHSDPHLNGFTEARELLRRRLYPEACYVVALTEEVARFLSPIAGKRGRVIPNAVLPGLPHSENKESEPGRLLMGMGRLSSEKGFALLLEAFAMISETHTDWSLEIWGEGPLRNELEQLTNKLGLNGRARLPGFTDRPFETLRRADLFAVSSLCEGWCNVLAEAMANGLAVVSFDCPSGPRNIIRNNVDGLLVPAQDVAAMAAALNGLMGNAAERRRLARRAPEVAERFSLERIMQLWNELVVTAPLEAREALNVSCGAEK